MPIFESYSTFISFTSAMLIGAVRVFENLARLGDAEARDGHDAIDDRLVEGDGQPEAVRVEAADDFGDIPSREILIAGVLALGAVGEEEVLPRDQAGLFEQRLEDFLGRPGVGAALQDDELPLAQVRHDRPAGTLDVREVRLAALAERRGDADDDDVGLDEPRGVVGRREPAAAVQLGDALGLDVADVALALAKAVDLLGVDVEADDREAAPGEGLGERQADVAEADDDDARLARLEAAGQLVGEGVAGGGRGGPFQAVHGRTPFLRGAECTSGFPA